MNSVVVNPDVQVSLSYADLDFFIYILSIDYFLINGLNWKKEYIQNEIFCHPQTLRKQLF